MVWFDSEGNALRNRTGKLTGVEGILTDVTERKIAERQAVSFSNILLTTAIESSPDAIHHRRTRTAASSSSTAISSSFGTSRKSWWKRASTKPVLMTVASRVKDKERIPRARALSLRPSGGAEP